MTARTTAHAALSALAGVLALWACVTAWDAEAAPACVAPPLHSADVACVCLTTMEPARWECWAEEGG